MAAADLNSLWTVAAAVSAAEFPAYIVDGFPELAAGWAAVTADMAAVWFEESAPASTYVAVTAEPIPAERLAQSARWALGASGDDGLARLDGTLQRAVFDGARETTMFNVTHTGSKWARYASANACAFCRLLATRGAAYTSKQTANTDVHDHCHCIAVEVREGQTYTPPDYTQQWEQQYIQAKREAESGDPQQILAAWRQLEGVK